MAGRYGGRFGTNQEQEQRRIQKEPVVVWKKDWILPTGVAASSNVKILKWVRTGDVINFDEEDVGEETMAMDVDTTNAMIEPLQQTSAIEDSLEPSPGPALDPAEGSVSAGASIIPQGTVREGTPTGETPPPEVDNIPIAAEPLGAVSAQAESQSTSAYQPLTQPSMMDSQEALEAAPEQPSSQLSEV